MNGKRSAKRKHSLKCKECNRVIIDLLRTKFCGNKCSYKFHSRIGRLKQVYEYKRPIKTKRKCLGDYCRGQKYFMSEGIWNRVCKKCENSPEFKSNVMTHKFEGSRRNSPKG